MAKKKFLCVLSACALTFGTAVCAFAKPDFKSFPAPVGKNSVLLNFGFAPGKFYPVMIGADISTLWGGTLSADYALPINYAFTVGLESAFMISRTVFSDDRQLSAYLIPSFVRVCWHPNWGIKNFDTYLLAKAGYGIGLWTGEGKNEAWTNPAGIAWGLNLGVRYFFANSFGVFIEGGYEYYSLNYEYKGEKYRYEYKEEYRNTPYSGKTIALAKRYLTVGITFKIGGEAAKADAPKADTPKENL